MVILFDKSFAGLLSAIAHCLDHRLQPQDLRPSSDPPSLLPETYVAAKQGVEASFRRRLARRCTAATAGTILTRARHAWYAQDPALPRCIHAYLRQACESGRDPASRLFEKQVREVVEAARKVGMQAHAYEGLLRFRKMPQGFYLADFRPDHLLLPLLLPHFRRRFAGQVFVIRDLKHHLAALCLADGRSRLLRLENSATPEAKDLATDSQNDPFDAMWQRYLKHLSIPERENRPLQQQNMPKKYWRYLTEQPRD